MVWKMMISATRMRINRSSPFSIRDNISIFGELAEDYDYLFSRYDTVAIGPKDWETGGSGAAGFRISATRRELIELLRDFKDTYPDAHITVMRS